MPRKKKLSFEESLTELDCLVEKIEQGNLPLEESLALFEKGILLSRECQTKLTDAEQKVTLLSTDAQSSEQPVDTV